CGEGLTRDGVTCAIQLRLEEEYQQHPNACNDNSLSNGAQELKERVSDIYVHVGIGHLRVGRDGHFGNVNAGRGVVRDVTSDFCAGFGFDVAANGGDVSVHDGGAGQVGLPTDDDEVTIDGGGDGQVAADHGNIAVNGSVDRDISANDDYISVDRGIFFDHHVAADDRQTPVEGFTAFKRV